MTLVLLISILIRLMATGISVRLLFRLREKRVGFLTVMLVLMTYRQILTLLAQPKPWVFSLTGSGIELPGLAVSVMVLLSVFFMEQILTEHKRAEEALRESEANFRTVFEQAAVGVAQIETVTGRFVQVNRRYCEIVGYTEEEMRRLTFQEITHPEDLQPDLDNMARLHRGQIRDFSMEKRYIRKDGAIVWVNLSVSAPWHFGGTTLFHTAVVEDISDRKQAEEALKRSYEQLRALSQRLVDLQETERRNIALELHDQIGQVLTGLKLTIEMCLKRPDHRVQDNLKEAKAMVDDLVSQVRELSLSLRPSMLDDLGLLPTLLWHFEHYTAQTGVRVAFRHDGLDRRFGPQVETAAYRIIQEALTNVARHAGGKEAEVRCEADSEMLRVEVEDRGVGFDPSGISPVSSGLTGMRERAELLGGSFSIGTDAGSGTRLTVRLPLVPAVRTERGARG